MRIATHRFAQFRRDRRRQRPHRIQHARRHLHRMAGAHENSHCLSDRPAHAEQHGRQQAALGRGKEHAINRLPLVCPQRLRRLAIRIRHRPQRILTHRHDHRHAHQPNDDPAIEHVHSHRRSGQLDDDRPHHHISDESPNHRRNRRQQLDGDLQRLFDSRRGKLRDINRRPKPDRHRQQHRQECH